MIREKMPKLGPTQQKILLILLAGVGLGLASSARVQLRIVRAVAHDWRAINRRALARAATSLYASKLIKKETHEDGTVTLVLTDQGKKRALRYKLETLSISRPKRWDGKWRVVMYDVPEELRRLRFELLAALKRLGFCELQHSVFAHPFPCTDEIDFLIESLEAREYVRCMVVEEIDISEPLRKHFAPILKQL